jgi:phage I-like protein
VNVRWTPDGARRLQERTQRFISPAFAHEGDRPTKLVNCALVSQPATHGAHALVAASKTARVSARISPAARAQLYLLAAKRKTTISAVLLSALDTIKCSATVTPTPEAMSALKSLLAALDLKDAGQPEVLAAIRSLLAATAEEVIRADPGSQAAPSGDADALQATPDPSPPAQLSRAELAAMSPAERGRYHVEADAVRRAQRARGDKPLASNLATRRR